MNLKVEGRPSRPELLSPLAYADFRKDLKLINLFLFVFILFATTGLPERGVTIFFLAMFVFLLLIRRASHGSVQDLLKRARWKSHPIAERGPAGDSYFRRFNNHLDLPLLPPISGAIVLYYSFKNNAFYFNERIVVMVALAILYLLLIRAIPVRGPLLWRCGYDGASDRFLLERRHWLSKEESRASWSADDFVGIYVEKFSPLLAALGLNGEQAGWLNGAPGLSLKQLAAALPPVYGRLWLAGRAGSADVPLADIRHWYYPNYQEAQNLAEKLSAASGLPLLYRWPAQPASLKEWPIK